MLVLTLCLWTLLLEEDPRPCAPSRSSAWPAGSRCARV